MVARITTIALQGIDVLPIDVQVSITAGLPAFTIVGLADKAVSEAKERVRSALHAMGLSLPPKRITVNLAPADVNKEGSHFDLAIALALLIELGALPQDAVSGMIATGELALDGQLSKVAGVLPAAIHAKSKGLGIICPAPNGGEALWAGEIQVIAAPSLLSLVHHFTGEQILTPPILPEIENENFQSLNLRDIKGQETAKRALEIAAAGGHHLLMLGPPGSGKSMLARRLPSILPPLDPGEALEVSMVHSVAGLLADGKISRNRPYRDPHHSASLAALIGGGLRAKPGEISLAHQGVLFLDELPEFQRAALESLRQPLETGRAVVARANAHVTYPARVQLIAAMNPCRCGYLDDAGRACGKAPRCGQDYQGKISGPIFDRIDLHVEVPAVEAGDLAKPADGEDSKTIAARVLKARAKQHQRFQHIAVKLNVKDVPRCNAEADGDILTEIAALENDAKILLNEAAGRLRLTARGYHRLLRVARTIADLADADIITRLHIAEAISYRRLSPAMQS
ncbi:MAG: YifB family Mg chelatase-like AAA ATPase [Dongiaceae bacterium]